MDWFFDRFKEKSTYAGLATIALSLVKDAIPIPFAGLVALQDKEDTEAMLRHQLQIVQAECMRLKELLTKNGIQH